MQPHCVVKGVDRVAAMKRNFKRSFLSLISLNSVIKKIDLDHKLQGQINHCPHATGMQLRTLVLGGDAPPRGLSWELLRFWPFLAWEHAEVAAESWGTARGSAAASAPSLPPYPRQRGQKSDWK